jgi:hypothetical protein
MNLTRNQNTNFSLQLHRKAFRHVDKIRPGMTVVCKKGLLWLTQTGAPNDYVLTPGEHLVVENRGGLLIEAIQEADLSVIYPN